MFGAGDCEEGSETSQRRSTRSAPGFRPLMFGAGDCEALEKALDLAEAAAAFQTPHVRGRGLRGPAGRAAWIGIHRVFQTPHVRGRGLRVNTCTGRATSLASMFQTPHVRGRGLRDHRPLHGRRGCGLGVSDPSCSGQGTASGRGERLFDAIFAAPVVSDPSCSGQGTASLPIPRDKDGREIST